MLQHASKILSKRMIRIDPSFTKLITVLRTATAKEYDLDKEATVHDDILDSFMLSITSMRFRGEY
jgi:hypothetical protein